MCRYFFPSNLGLLKAPVSANPLEVATNHIYVAAPVQAPGVVDPAVPLKLQAAYLAVCHSPKLLDPQYEPQAVATIDTQVNALLDPSLEAAVKVHRRQPLESTMQIKCPVELDEQQSARIDATKRRIGAVVADLNATSVDIPGNVIAASLGEMAALECIRPSQQVREHARCATTVADMKILDGGVSSVGDIRVRGNQSGVRLELAHAGNELASPRNQLNAPRDQASSCFEMVSPCLGKYVRLSRMVESQLLLGRIDNSQVVLSVQSLNAFDEMKWSAAYSGGVAGPVLALTCKGTSPPIPY